MNHNSSGFTIIDLIVAIVVIGILASLAIINYIGILQSARDLKVTSDLRSLTKVIEVARINEGKTLEEITGSNNTYIQCFSKPTGTDLAALPKTDQCWIDYYSALEKIGDASGANIMGLVDPMGRPYYINENEGDIPGNPCVQDVIAMYSQPFVHNQYRTSNAVSITNSLSSC